MANPEQEIPIEFTLKPDLLDRINRALKELGSSAKYKKAPKYKPGFEHLRDKTVVIIDDVYGVLEGFIPEMMVASNGNADFIHFTNQSKEELVRQIMEKNPDIVFLDYNLSDELKGSAIAKQLKSEGFGGDVIGFSSDPGTSRDFQNAGARACLNKDINDFAGQLEKSPEAFAPRDINNQ